MQAAGFSRLVQIHPEGMPLRQASFHPARILHSVGCDISMQTLPVTPVSNILDDAATGGN
jgi:hypothetical protein